MKALIVEDERTDSKLLGEFLAPFASCETVQDGKEALSVFQESIEAGSPFSLISLDINLPGMTGHDLLGSMRSYEAKAGLRHDERAVIVMATSASDMRSILRATEGGCNGYIIKPFDKQRVLTELEKFGLGIRWQPS